MAEDTIPQAPVATPAAGATPSPTAPKPTAKVHPAMKPAATPAEPVVAEGGERPKPKRRNQDGHVVGEQLSHEQLLALKRKAQTPTEPQGEE